MTQPAPAIVVAALYRFTPFEACDALRAPLEEVCRANGVRGTLLLAAEGINGTIAGSRQGIDAVLGHIRALPGCADLDVKESAAPLMPFDRMKVRLKREIVTMGVDGIDAAREAGTHVEPEDWNALIRRPDVVVIDTRNDYEVEIGSFAGAINPATSRFRDFPQWFDDFQRQMEGARAAGQKKPAVAMFCTGGIRCEKATAYVKAQGLDEVYHLRGGVLKYLERIAPEDSLWQGECYVFDQRVSVGHGLAQGSHGMCRACGRPVPLAAGDDARCAHCAADAGDCPG